jgi:tetratricopeptide (TPR) repeat protein
MHVITIAQKTTLDNAFEAVLTIGGSEFEVRVSDPFWRDGREKQLEWYFEEWIRFTFTGTVAATSAAASVKDYGVALFEQVFGDRANAAYRQVVGKLSELEILIEGDPEFQSLHWEAMWDKEMSRPLAVDCVMVRQRAVRGNVPIIERKASETLNLLVLTARPGEDKDVGYRTISRLLVEGIGNAHVPVNVELVRPGTYEAFVKQLASKPEGYYHVVHFDMHGCVMNFKQLKGRLNDDNDYTFQRDYDLPDFAAYEGMRAFLLFETDQAGHAMPVSAKEMADLLKYHGISVCILNACQSGKQLREGETDSFDGRETSLGARLIDAGVQTVIAMAYSVTVDAAKLMVENLYKNLFAQMPIDRALQRARRELHARKERSVGFRQKVDLEDWLLPVVYRNQIVDLKLRPMETETDYFAKKTKRFQFGRQFQTTYGFVGRDLEILKLEKGLIRDGNILMLYGMGGTGKTTLLRYLQDWWVLTGFVDGVSYFGYDQQAWNLRQILFNVAQDVLTESALRSFQTMLTTAQMGKLAQVLKTRRWLVVLDNLESVTGQALAIQNTLSEAEQAGIRDFLMQIKRGQSRVLLGSRRRETWLAQVYDGNEYELRGLDDQARSDLAQMVLERHFKDGAKRRLILADKDFARLMNLLAGYPLAISVVLSNLGRQSVNEVLAGLDLGDVDLDRDGDKTRSMLQCIDSSHGNLSKSAQRSLLCLAFFSGFIDRSDLKNYAQNLQATGSLFADLTFGTLDGAVQDAIDLGLLAPMSVDNPNLLTIQPVFPYFLKTKLAQMDAEFREVLRLGFKNHYEGLAEHYNQMMESKEAEEKQFGVMFCKLEYENLYAALTIALERQESIQIFFCLGDYFDLTQNPIARLEVAKQVNLALRNYPPEFKQGEQGYQISLIMERIGRSHLELKQYSEARIAYQSAIKSYEEYPLIDQRQKQLSIATDYHQLGMVAQELREYEQAHKDYQQALQIYIEYNDRYEQAGTYHQLGIVAQTLCDYEQARKDYQHALEIKAEYNDYYSQASTYHQLGTVAHELREYKQARKDYQHALKIYTDYDDSYSQAATYHQLGMVAEELREYEQARKYYQQTLQIQIEYNVRYEQSATYHQLGIVAEELQEYEQARKDYQQTLQIQIEYDDRYSQARTYHQLGRVAEALKEFEESESNYLKALQIYVEYNDQRNLGIVFRSCKCLYQSHSSDQLLSAIGQAIGCSEADVLQLFEQL